MVLRTTCHLLVPINGMGRLSKSARSKYHGLASIRVVATEEGLILVKRAQNIPAVTARTKTVPRYCLTLLLTISVLVNGCVYSKPSNNTTPFTTRRIGPAAALQLEVKNGAIFHILG